MEKNGVARTKLRTAISIAAIVITVAACTVLCAYAGMESFVKKDAEVYAAGVTINGHDAGGRTFDDVKAELVASEEAYKATLGATVRVGSETIVLTADDLGYHSDLTSVMQEAKNYIDNKADTLTERFDATQSVRLDGVSFASEAGFDPAKAIEKIELAAREESKPPVETTVSFDGATETFTYNEGKGGIQYLPAKIIDEIIDAATSGAGGEFVCPSVVVEPEHTEQEARYNTILIGEMITYATKDADRNTNIRLMCEAVNGLSIMPGDIFSINGIVGERTEDKGFKKAPSIVSAQLVDDFGGGICQLSGTLYNAALIADMEIVERHHHTWPSDYLPIGLDATLNWDNKDLKLRNVSEWPIYIYASLNEETQEVTVRLYGSPNKGGYDVAIRTVMIEEIPAPDYDIIRTDKLSPGEKRIEVKARKGYSVEVYRDYYSDSKLVYSEIISKDYFRPIKGVIMVGVDETQK